MKNLSNYLHQEEQTLRELLSDLCTLLQEFKKNQESCYSNNCKRVACQQERGGETELSEDLVDAVDVQELFRITKSTYYRWVKKGILTPIRMNRKDFYRKSELQELLQRRKYRERGF